MSRATVGERYARAIFELGLESGQLDALVTQCEDFARTYRESPELMSVLDNPLVEPVKREAVLLDVAGRVGLTGLGLNAIRLLAARHKLPVLPELARRLRAFADRHAGIVRVSVTSAIPLSDPFYQSLERELEAAISRRVVLERRQDPSLIAGVVTRIGDYTIDGSLKSQLAELERQLQSV